MPYTRLRQAVAAAAALMLSSAQMAGGQAAELNLYSSRHYQTDEALYETFTAETGIEINRIEGKGDALIERIKAEGANSPADVFITVDAGRLWRAEQAGLFQAVESNLLDELIPANLRHPDGLWFGFSTRARLIYYNKAAVAAGEIKSYEDLADPKWKGRVCIRSSSNIYNQSLLGGMIAAHGEQGAERWAAAVVANFARDPQGGDTDQIKAVAAGECDLSVGNSYYYVRLAASDDAAKKAVADQVGWVFPNQDGPGLEGRGTHVNVSGAGVLKHAPNRDAAAKFLEYLAGKQAQSYFANGNNEYPVVAGVDAKSAVEALGSFKIDPVNVAIYGENQPSAQRIFDRAGWK